MSDKPSMRQRSTVVRQAAIGFAAFALWAFVTYPSAQHTHGAGARAQWLITCLVALFLLGVVLPAFILRTRALRQKNDAANIMADDATKDGQLLASKLSVRPADDPWWQGVFARFDAGERSPKNLSIIGLFLGPLYYFILMMWRKALAILGIALSAAVVLDLLHVLLGLPSAVQNVVGFAMGVFCMVMVKRDYYMLKRHEEIMWRQTKWLNGRIALAALIAIPLLVEFGRGIAKDPDDAPNNASTRLITPGSFADSTAAISASASRPYRL